MKSSLVLYPLSFILLFSCSIQEKNTSIEQVILRENHPYFSINTENYPQRDASLPIGIFDSGTGGLTVLDAIINFDQHNNRNQDYVETGDGKVDFKSECFIYLGDQANMPYGNYSRENNLALLKEHIIKDVHFLLGNKYYRDASDNNFQTDKQPVKAIVIACNTATAYGKKEIEVFLNKAELDVRVIGVIGAGVRGAFSVISKEENAGIGVMATAGTVSSGGYETAIQRWKRQLGYTGEIFVFQQAGIGLAGAIDGSPDYISLKANKPRSQYKGPSIHFEDARLDDSILERYGFDWDKNHMLFEDIANRRENIQINSIENYIAYHVVSLMETIRKNGKKVPLKAIILGCTHYPFFMEVFKAQLDRLYQYQEDGEYVYRPHMSEEIVLIDPAINTAKELYLHLKTEELFNQSDLSRSEFYISVPNPENVNNRVDTAGNFTYDYKYGRQAGDIQEYVKRVPFSRRTLKEEKIKRLKQKIPETFEYIRRFNHDNQKLQKVMEEERIM